MSDAWPVRRQTDGQVKFTGWDKFVILDGNCHLSRKQYEIGARYRPKPVISNGKSLVADRSVSAAVTSSDLDLHT